MQNFNDNLGRYAGLKNIYDHWNSIRQEGNLIPFRKDLQIQSILHELPSCFMLQYQAPDSLRIRLLGSDIVEREGQELTGMDLMDIYDQEHCERLLHLMTRTLEQPCITQVDLSTGYSNGISRRRLMTFFPLRDADGQPNKVFGYDYFIEIDNFSVSEIGTASSTIFHNIDFFDVGGGIPEEDFANFLEIKIPKNF